VRTTKRRASSSACNVNWLATPFARASGIRPRSGRIPDDRPSKVIRGDGYTLKSDPSIRPSQSHRHPFPETPTPSQRLSPTTTTSPLTPTRRNPGRRINRRRSLRWRNTNTIKTKRIVGAGASPARRSAALGERAQRRAEADGRDARDDAGRAEEDASVASQPDGEVADGRGGLHVLGQTARDSAAFAPWPGRSPSR
jgi:hypothetical protein